MADVPAGYSPLIAPTEFIVEPIAGDDERLEVGVLFVGGGPAGLAGAIRLAQLLETAPDIKAQLGDVPIAVVEKGKYPGAHLVSGAVVNPVALRALFPAKADSDFPFRTRVREEAVYLLSRTGQTRVPTPPTMRNHGYYSASLSEIARWLGEQAESLGVTLLTETTAAKVLMKDGAVHGIVTGDKGLGRDGAPLSNHEPGAEVHARATVISEGVLGHLTMALVEYLGLHGPNPQSYALGVKEVWDVPKPLAKVIHTMGWPLRPGREWREFGGSFLYPLGEKQVSLGLVVGLDHADCTLSVHDLLQDLKSHPLVKDVLEGGTRNEKGWGAKTIPEGGWYATPTRLALPGALLTGDAAGLVNVPSLKGVHYAMWSGMLAAQTIFAALKAGVNLRGPRALADYDTAVRGGFIGKDLFRVRNMRQAFGAGFVPGAALAGLMTASLGLLPPWRLGAHRDSEYPLKNGASRHPKPDGKLTFDKLSSVYASGNRTRDTQPNHLRIRTDVPRDVGDAWIAMCPAAVYEWGEGEDGKKVLLVNAPNCVQCGAITAKGGRFTPPEGGSGPEYTLT
ncbi:MAG: 4Fe-4S dicluster domain-containing protein [Gemmatimonadales bacterium]